MVLYPASGIQHHYREAFAFGSEIWILNNVGAPVGCGGLRGVAQLEIVRSRTFPEGDNFVFMRLIGKAEWFHRRNEHD
jgi:hypothetical protein